MRKFLTLNYLESYGWKNVEPGKNVVSYCATCDAQKQHLCTGQKQENGTLILRLECQFCRERADGGAV